LPTLQEAMTQYLTAARVTNPDARFIGISLDTSKLDEARRAQLRAGLEAQFRLPVVDPMRDGATRLAEAIARGFPQGGT
jgi:uncharacterized NAD-dependent epimerase/dehydratase family protein